ncbi:MAG: prohibitin family protein [Ignavibacteriaceae bacterium]|nr:prohibitin family protein [Ignavibacteriaceae bacterium]
MLFIIALIAAVAAFVVRIGAKKRLNKSEASFALAGIVVALIIAFSQLVTIIPAGHTGVVDFLGNVSDNTLSPGVNLVNPMAKVVKYSFKTQEIKENMTIPSKEGLPIQLELSLLFRLDPAKANEIYKTVEEGDYLNVILVPQFRSVTRGVTAKFEAQALYTEARERLANEIVTELQKLVGPRGITIERVPLRQIVLPAGLTRSIEEKMQADQESQRMAFILLKEKQEAERKLIEAKGISDYNNVVNASLTERILKQKGIDATLNLANSSNSKVIVIGSGKDGLPLILGGN